jgi:bifunctional non-homologous end joining protein LigD
MAGTKDPAKAMHAAVARAGKQALEVEVEGRRLQLTNLDKVMYPKTGFTKRELIDYYVRISPWLLPHLAGRPLSLKRYPNGVEAPFFYQKECPAHRPEWLPTTNWYSETRGADIEFCMADSLADLVWLANAADLELHTYLCTFRDTDRPTTLAFDLDPGEGAGVLECAEVAEAVRAALGHLGLECFPKVSGAKGIQVYAPLNTPMTYAQTKPFARRVAEALEAALPELVTSNMRKALRAHKVLVDWSQNDTHKTTVCVYSLRGRPEPSVSVPLSWPELERLRRRGDPEGFRFGPDDAVRRAEKLGDLFAPVLTMQQRLSLQPARPGSKAA